MLHERWGMDPLIDALQEQILNWLDQFTQALDRPEIVTRYQELRAAIEA